MVLYTSTTLPSMFLQTGLFILAWATADTYVSRNRTVAGWHAVTVLNSRLYALVSLALLILILVHDSPLARKLYHASKAYEYLDILNVTLASGVGSVGLHFGFHHLTTPWFTYIRVLPGCAAWRWFAALNAAHHVFMYAYFGGWEAVRPILDFTGIGQLVGGIAAEVWCVRLGRDEVWRHWIALGLLGSYLILSIRDIRTRKTREKAVKEE
jgi:hypothetical protein